MLVWQIEFFIFSAAAFLMFGIEAWALINAVRFPAAAYDAAMKRTKLFWGGVCAVSAVVGLLTLPILPFRLPVLGIMPIIAVTAAGVFLADVLPALRSVMGNAQGRYGRR
ncbi:DUF2516 family protein [Dermabacteraceae bacterium TAE3-ERU27]|nr:DUF2516 family protein [Dermabacteraceae bacterium TAE3-ERU27]